MRILDADADDFAESQPARRTRPRDLGGNVWVSADSTHLLRSLQAGRARARIQRLQRRAREADRAPDSASGDRLHPRRRQRCQEGSLFADVRAGRVRILLGSTQKMGLGTNVQDRLYAVHHLDAPWRPADIEQRDGRMMRRGNTNAYVRILRYVTQRSFDAYTWQLLEYKARMIAQVMRGDAAVRRIEDLETAVLTYAQMKALASGDPLVMKKAAVDAEVARLSRAKKAFEDRSFLVRLDLARLPDRIRELEATAARIGADLARRLDTSGNLFRIEIAGREYAVRADAAARLRRILVDETTTNVMRRVLRIARSRVSTSKPVCSGAFHPSSFFEASMSTRRPFPSIIPRRPDPPSARASASPDGSRKAEGRAKRGAPEAAAQ
ncbi:MAG: helicase-related protein [Longimicrobiales bacterium]